MRKFYIAVSFVYLFLFSAWAENDVKFFMNSGEVRTVSMARIDSLSFDDEERYLIVTLADRVDSLLISNIDSIIHGTLATAVQVKYAGEHAVVENPFAFDGVNVDIAGAKVTIRSTLDSDVDYVLSGESDEGCFKIYGTKKYTLRLNGLSLANNTGAAINSQCKKRGKIILEEGTFNKLSDATVYDTPASEDEKATLFSEGQFVFEGAGSLQVDGNYKHAICSDDYIAFREGNISVTSAVSDAVHCNDSLIVAGGVISLASSGDGIDCDGHITISGGDLSISLAGEGKEGIKAVGEINIIDGNLSIDTSGDMMKGIKSSRDINVCGGVVDVKMGGNSIVELGDVSYCTAIKSDSVFTMSGGVLNIEATGLASCGISADCDVNIIGGECNVTCSGDYGIYNPAVTDESVDGETIASYVVYVSKPSSSSAGGNRPGASSNSWNNVYLYDSNDNLVSTLTSNLTINGVQFYYYDFGTSSSDTYYFKSDNSRGYTIKSNTFTGVQKDVYYTISSSYSTSGNVRTYSLIDVTESYESAVSSSGSSTEKSYAAACIKSDANINIFGGEHELSASGDASKGIKSDGDCCIAGGTIEINTTGAAAIVAFDPTYCSAIKSDGNFNMSAGSVIVDAQGQGGIGISSDSILTISGGNVDITISGAGNSYTATSGTDYYSVKALKSDGAMNLLGGTITCNSTGNGGKCIVSDGVLTIGDTARNDGYPIISAKTTGAALGTSSGSMGGFGGMGGNEGFNAAPKAIKGESDVVINGGTVYASTAQDGGEGIESKATLTINRGLLECATYDDAINAATSIIVNGGYIYAWATNNDAIDSNGTIEINDGVVLASGSTQPEGGIDCDNNSFSINGGIVLATGGAASSPTSVSQYYASISSVNMSQGKYLVFKDSTGGLLFSYKCPNSVSGASVLVSSPAFTSSSHTMLYGVSSVSSATANYFNGVFLVGGVATGGTSKNFTPSTK